VGQEKADLEEPAPGIDQQVNSLPGRELALGVLAVDPLRTAALAQSVLERPDLVHHQPHA